MKQTQSNKKQTPDRKPKSLFILLLGVLGAALLMLSAFLLYPRQEVEPDYVPEVVGGPSLKVDKEQIDFGDVKINQYLTAEFELTNVGDEVLRFGNLPYVEIIEGC